MLFRICYVLVGVEKNLDILQSLYLIKTNIDYPLPRSTTFSVIPSTSKAAQGFVLPSNIYNLFLAICTMP